MRQYKHCNCADYDKNVAHVNSATQLLYAGNPETYKGYQGKAFEFCPWCGTKLIELEIVDRPRTVPSAGIER